MKNLRLLTLSISLFACQEDQDNTPASQVEDTQHNDELNVDDNEEEEEEEEEAEEAEEEGEFVLPDVMHCSSVAMKQQTIRMELQKVFVEASASFTLGYVHDSELGDLDTVLDSVTFQAEPVLGDHSIDMVFTAEDAIDGNDGFFDGEVSFSVHLWEHGLFTGHLESAAFGTLDFHCWEMVYDGGAFVPADEKEFFYNGESGLCESAEGEEGYNSSSVMKVRETGDGECVNMSYWALEEGNFSYPNLDWDVRGALMYGTQLYFANMDGADFRGSNLYGLEFGYARLRGPIDAFTLLPELCDAASDEVDCVR